MSNPESGAWSGPGRADRDPITSMIAAMRDVCLAGAAALESAALESVGGPSMTNGNRRTASPGKATGPADGGAEHSVTSDFVLPIGQAMMIAASRSASCWLGLAQILATHQTKSARAIGAAAIDNGTAESQRLAAAEEMRALLREVGDLATREARIFQNDLGSLGESLAQTFQQPDPSTPYRRRWRTKL